MPSRLILSACQSIRHPEPDFRPTNLPIANIVKHA
jgi:hypothetical protein